MLDSIEYAEKYFPGVDEITKLRVSIAYMDGAIAKAKEITDKLREENEEIASVEIDKDTL